MKRIICCVLLLCYIVVLSGCAQTVEAPAKSTTDEIASVEPSDTSTDVDESTDYGLGNCTVDIFDEYWGQYLLMTNATFEHYDEDGVPDHISINDPALLAFRVGSELEGGLGLIEGTSVTYLITQIETYLENNDISWDDEQMFNELLNILNNVTVLTGAST